MLENILRNMLLEALTPSQKRTVAKWNTKADDPKKQILGESGKATLEVPAEEKVATVPHIIEDHLNEHGYDVEPDDYMSGYASKNVEINHPQLGKMKKKVVEKIGTALTKTNAPKEVFQAYENDKNRAFTGSSASNLRVSIFSPFTKEGKCQYAAQSTDQGWTSCKNMDDGSNKKYLRTEVANGAHIAYLHSKDDEKVERPSARINLNVYDEYDGYTKTGRQVLVPARNTYGQEHSGFSRLVNEWANNNTPMHQDKTYRIASGTYADGAPEEFLPYDKLDEHIRTLKTAKPHETMTIKNAYLGIRNAITNPSLPKSYVKKVMDNYDIIQSANTHGYPLDRFLAKSPHLENDHITKILDARKFDWQSLGDIIDNKHFGQHHAKQIIDSGDQSNIAALNQKFKLNNELKERLIDHYFTGGKSVDKFLGSQYFGKKLVDKMVDKIETESKGDPNTPEGYIPITYSQINASKLIEHDPAGLNAEHISKLIDLSGLSNNYSVRIAHRWSNNPKITKEHIEKIHSFAIDPNLTPSTLKAVQADRDNFLALHKNTPDHILDSLVDKAHKEKNIYLAQNLASRFDSLKPHNLKKILSLGNEEASSMIYERHNIPESMKQELFDRTIDDREFYGASFFHSAFLRNKNITEDDISKIIDNHKESTSFNSHMLMENVAKHPKLNEDHLRKLTDYVTNPIPSQGSNDFITNAIAKNPKTPDDLQERLFTNNLSKGLHTTNSLIQNPNLSVSIISHLLQRKPHEVSKNISDGISKDILKDFKQNIKNNKYIKLPQKVKKQ